MTRVNEMRKLTENIADLAVSLRKPIVREPLGTLCPTICRTRWMFIVDVLIWKQHESSINNTFVAMRHSENRKQREFARRQLPERIPEVYWQFLEILWPLKLFLLCVERSESHLCDVPLYVRQLLTMYRDLKWTGFHQTIQVIGHCLIAIFLARIRQNAMEESIAAYVLSPC